MQPLVLNSLRKHVSEYGKLVFLETESDIPFDIKRVYYIYDVSGDVRRGFHAHKTLRQALICVHGSCRVMLDDGDSKVDFLLNDPSETLLVEGVVWREMYDFSPDAVLLVLASEHYDESEYIRDYQEFLDYTK